jgi:polar amino acid transport system substrate-binding protein
VERRVAQRTASGRRAILAAGLVCAACTLLAPSPRQDAARMLAPSGTLRVAINLGNPVLASKDPVTGRLVGVSVDLAALLASRLGTRLELLPYPSAGAVTDDAQRERWDVAFLARDPKRAETLYQTAAYLAIEGVYLVRADSPMIAAAAVDVPGIRVAVGAGSAYDLYLSRTLQHARVVRAATSTEVTDLFMAEHLDVAAGVREQLEADARRLGGLRLLPGHFMQIEQALALPRTQAEGAQALEAFVADVKHSGLIARLLAEHSIEGAVPFE